MAKTTEQKMEYVRCEDVFREVDPGLVADEICNKLRETARNSSELVRLKHTAVDMLRRCRDGDSVACKFFRKLQNAPAWRIESLVKEYMQHLKYLDCMRNYSDEKMCRRYLPAHEKNVNVQNVEENLQKFPVEYVVEDDVIVVKVGRGEKLPESQFKAVISELKKMGFEFDPDTKLWRMRI